jgi:hypothetical protein
LAAANHFSLMASCDHHATGLFNHFYRLFRYLSAILPPLT